KPEFVTDEENSEDEPPKAEEVEITEEQQPLFPLFLRRLGVAEKPLDLCTCIPNTYSGKFDKRQVYLSLPECEIYNSSSPANENFKVHLSGVTGKAREQVVESLTMVQKALNRNRNQEVIRAEGICSLVYQTMNNMLFAPIINENLCEQDLDTSSSVPVVTIKTISNSVDKDQTELLYIQRSFAAKSRIKISFEWLCFDRVCFKPTDSRNLHISPYCLQFLSLCHIDCHCELSSKLFYAYEESGCFTKALPYLLTATNAQSRRKQRRRMPRKPNRYNRGRGKVGKGKSDGASRSSGLSLDEAVSSGVVTSSDTHTIESEIRNQSTVVGALDLQKQSIIICPDADTIVSTHEECALPDPEQNESSIQGSRNESETVHEGHNNSHTTVDGRDVPSI
ncbi:MAG: hypothetical protein GY861_03470, partial [bacterium]|nr:hypothetical protein [bacterium]